MGTALRYSLTDGTPDAWRDFAHVAGLHLTKAERAALAFAALASLAPDDAMATAAAVIGAGGGPLPPFLGGMDDARHWASYASRAELKAYLAAAFAALAAHDRAAFLTYAAGARAA